MRRDTNTKTTAATTPNRKTAFQTERLTENTFLITEVDDIYDERPQIFVKRLANNCKLLVIDTGCGGATNDPDVQITGLREYLETVPLECNANEPLNASELGYIVVATHCHYDHIRTRASFVALAAANIPNVVGIEQFADANARILVSAHSPYFISPANLPKHSLCADMGIHTPKYTPILVPHRHEIAPDVFILHTPGHTPDELAVYDATEKMLYVGDTLYEEDTIIFPNEGSIVDWTRCSNQLGAQDTLAAG
ncbi:Metallo-hydrolase/oxidoreductase [Mycena kentingensis (nom. inval.)]|nr:Metallo-hydrolase/oxidoreductase [Mycena kentingensis (nom. inval.)]